MLGTIFHPTQEEKKQFVCDAWFYQQQQQQRFRMRDTLSRRPKMIPNNRADREIGYIRVQLWLGIALVLSWRFRGFVLQNRRTQNILSTGQRTRHN
jgi:hypothetical protein